MSRKILDQIEQDVKSSLTFPFHIHHDRLSATSYYNPDYPDSYHEHSFDRILMDIYWDPDAFFLTDDDKKFYSNQEIELINKVIDVYRSH